MQCFSLAPEPSQNSLTFFRIFHIKTCHCIKSNQALSLFWSLDKPSCRAQKSPPPRWISSVNMNYIGRGTKFFCDILMVKRKEEQFEGLVLLQPNLAYFWSNCVASGDQAVFDLLQTMVPAGQLCYSLRLSVERSSGYTTQPIVPLSWSSNDGNCYLSNLSAGLCLVGSTNRNSLKSAR